MHLCVVKYGQGGSTIKPLMIDQQTWYFWPTIRMMQSETRISFRLI